MFPTDFFRVKDILMNNSKKLNQSYVNKGENKLINFLNHNISMKDKKDLYNTGQIDIV